MIWGEILSWCSMQGGTIRKVIRGHQEENLSHAGLHNFWPIGLNNNCESSSHQDNPYDRLYKGVSNFSKNISLLKNLTLFSI